MTALIREARLEDEPRLRDLYAVLDRHHCEALPGLFRAADDPVAARNIVGEMQDPNGVLLVAEVAGRLVGLAGARVVEIGESDSMYLPRRYVYADDMVVLPDFRGRGIGQALLAGVETWARERDAATVELTVFEFNEEACRLYERAGFVTQQRRMRKPL